MQASVYASNNIEIEIICNSAWMVGFLKSSDIYAFAKYGHLDYTYVCNGVTKQILLL